MTATLPDASRELTLPELADAIDEHTNALKGLRSAQRRRIVERIEGGATWSVVQREARVSRATIMAVLRASRGAPASS